MSPRSFLLPLAAAVLLHAAPAAAAQHDHGAAQKRSESAAAKAGIAEGTVSGDVRIVDMQVTEDGFVPSKIKTLKGQRLRLNITRKTARTCATEIVVKDHGINTPLPLDQTVSLEFTPKKSGELKYACGMGHITGVIFIP